MTIKNSHLKTVAYTASLLISSNLLANSNCSDELYGINAGRGESGYAMELNLRHSGDISSENPVIKVHSKALFSSAAMAYVNSKNRIYYISAPRAGKYAAGIDWNNVLDDVNSTEEKSLPFFSKKQIQVEIAYIDLDSGEHISLAKLPYWKRMYRLAYDPSDGHLYGSHYNRFYKINPQTGETIDLDRFSGHSSPKDIWRGDLAYKDGALYLVTNTKIFKVNKNTSVLSELATHNLQNITGAIFDKDDNLILSQLRVSDYGSFNKSKLHNVSLITGDTCKIMDVPAEISDLAYINPKLAPPRNGQHLQMRAFLIALPSLCVNLHNYQLLAYKQSLIL